MDKGIICRICKELKNLNSQRTNNPINKWLDETESAQKKYE
jgi:hypothetical protein